MVLDEDALERMLARGGGEADRPPAQAQLTDETDEFEVWERPSDDPPMPDPTEPEIPGPPAPPEPAPVETAAPAAAPSPIQVAAQEASPAPEAPAAPAAPAPPAQPAAPMFQAPTHAPEPQAPAPPAPEPMAQPATGGDVRIGLVQCDFNSEITDRMVADAQERAEARGATIAAHVHVPGVYDAPLATQRLARTGEFDAIVVVGCVIKGDTDHDQVITHATALSLQQVSLAEDIPVGLGIIGPGMSWAEAEARIGNAGHAVDAAIVQVGLLR